MMAICPICGRRTCIHWPEHWVYRRGSTYYCSDNCMYVDATRDMQMMHKAIHKRKEAWKNMARMKKDGTPAKKPGRKPAAVKLSELAEKMAEDGVQLVYDPSIAEEYRREQEAKKAAAEAKAEEKEWTPAEEVYGRAEDEEDDQPHLTEAPADIWRTTAVSNARIGEFYFDRKYRTIDWRSPEGEEVSLVPEDWKKLADIIPQILHTLGADD